METTSIKLYSLNYNDIQQLYRTRQGSQRVHRWFTKGLADDEASTSKKIIMIINPVSYTHLDVYKRQPLLIAYYFAPIQLTI